MNSTDFKQANFTLKAGGNTKTVGLRCALCAHAKIPGPPFYVSKWEMEDFEKEVYRAKIADIVETFDYLFMNKAEKDKKAFIDKIMSAMPKIWLSAMGAPTPVMVLASSPIDEPYPFIDDFFKPLDSLAKSLQKPNHAPEDN